MIDLFIGEKEVVIVHQRYDAVVGMSWQQGEVRKRLLHAGMRSVKNLYRQREERKVRESSDLVLCTWGTVADGVCDR